MGIQVHWKDGLPDDPLERAQIEQILTSGGLTSKYSAIKRLRDGDASEAAAELERIAREEAEKAARAAAAAEEGAPLREEQQGQSSRSSKETLAKLKIDRGQNVKGPGRRG